MACRSAMALAVAPALSMAAGAALAQDALKYPDWSGQWKRPAGTGGQWDLTKPPGRGQQAPLTPEYQAIFDASLADRDSGGLGGDPTGMCLPHGMPRMMIAIFPIEFIVTPTVTYILTDYTTPRRIFTDGRSWPADLQPSFNGYSIGNWLDQDGDGRFDTLEVETRGFKSPRTFEGSGLPLHQDGQSIIKERLRLDAANKDILLNETTVIDNALTRPWTVSRRYQRDRNGEWFIIDCAENNPHVVIGTEFYMLSADGFLMPTKNGQVPPDLRYFNRSQQRLNQ
jgi:hypothetical protein